MLKYWMGLIGLLLILAACSPAEPTPAPTSTSRGSIATPTREGALSAPNDSGEVQGDPGSGFGFETTFAGGFEAIVAGGRSAVMDGNGYFACENDQYVIRPSDDGLQQVTLIVNPGVRPGTHQLGNQGASAASAMVAFDDGAVYAGDVQGLLVLNNIAAAPEQRVRGSFDFRASNGTDTVNVAGEFDFMSASRVRYC